MSAKTDLVFRIYDDYNTTVLRSDLTGRWSSLRFSTQLHGGFGTLQAVVPMRLPAAWPWLAQEGYKGYHYKHAEVRDGADVVWEGRLANIGIDMVGNALALNFDAFGYYSSLRDQMYSASDGGSTNWKVGGPHNAGKIIREMITNRCPDINGTADVTLSPEDVVGIDLTVRSYPMDVIIDKLAPVAGSGTNPYYFTVYESRKPAWTERAIGTTVNWYCYLPDISRLSLTQQGMHLRNWVMPTVGTTEGTGSLDADSTSLYVRRDMVLSLGTGIPTTAANTARDMAISEHKTPRQDQSFSLSGHIYRTQAGNIPQSTGSAFSEARLYFVRAGDTIRIQDLVPYSAATGSLDDIRTFFIAETVYDADRNVLDVLPDRPPGRLGILMARLGQLELKR